MWGLGDGPSQQVGGLQAAVENLFLEGFIPPAGETGNKPLNTCMHISLPLPDFFPAERPDLSQVTLGLMVTHKSPGISVIVLPSGLTNPESYR